jgi:hypothetical protein
MPRPLRLQYVLTHRLIGGFSRIFVGTSLKAE